MIAVSLGAIDGSVAAQGEYAAAATGEHRCPAGVAFSIGGETFGPGDVTLAEAQFDERGMPVIDIEFSTQGQARFVTVQEGRVGSTLPICLGDTIMSEPRLVAPITGSGIEIAGSMTAQETIEAARLLRTQLGLAEKASMASAPKPKAMEVPLLAEDDAAFVGHYYLSGVHEVGSELVLRANGTFDWFMSYGAVDQTGQGIWHRDGETIVLTASRPAKDTPLFAYLETEPWSERAEQEVLRLEYEARAAAVRAACPFLTDDWVSTATAVAVDEGRPKPSIAVLRQRAADALAKAITARTQVETLARQAMGNDVSRPVGDAIAEQARQRLSDWLDAKEQAQQTALAAGLPDIRLAGPVLPVACAIPPMDEVGDAPAIWTGRIGVRVFDRESEQGVSDVQVLLHFADGHDEQIITARRGLAVLPGKVKKAVTGATLHADYAKGRDASFTFAPVINGIIHFSIDGRQLAQSSFMPLRLNISGKALIPEDFGKGRYER